jgi:hypothetical protein
MQREKENSASEKATIASSITALRASITEQTTPEQFCNQLARVFQVQQTEVALLRADSGLLKFIFPPQLKTAGSIPVSSATSIVAHTATTKKAELYNNFCNVKHASIFETVKLGSPEDNSTFTNPPIQRLISAPVLDAAGNVIGVLQVCRKGYDLRSAGPDFTSEHLQQVERAARVVALAHFMRQSAAASAT